MDNYILFDATDGIEAKLSFDLGGSLSEVYVEIVCQFSAADLAAWFADRSSSSPDFIEVGDGAVFLTDIGATGAYNGWWDAFSVAAIPGHVEADTPHTAQYLYNTPRSAMQYEVDGDASTFTSGIATSAASEVIVGLASPNDPLGQLKVASIKVGTTFGGSDLLDFDAATAADLSAFTLFGSVTLVQVPPTPPATVGYRSPFWRFVVGDLLTFETLSFLDRLATQRLVTYTLNQAAVAEGVVPSDSPEINIPWPDSDSDPFLTEGSRVLWGFRQEGALDAEPVWQIRFAGIIQKLEDAAQSDNATSKFTAYDPWQYLMSRPVCNADGTLPGPEGISFTATRIDVIAGTLLNNTIQNQGDVGIDAGLLYGGTGDYTGTIETLDAIDINFAQGTSVGQAWQQLCNAALCDIILEPIYDPINRPTYLVQFNIYAEAGAARDDAIFAWDMPSRSLVGVDRTYSGTERANVVKYFAGAGGSAPGGQGIVEKRDTASVDKFGEYWRQQFFPTQIVAAAVEALAEAQLELSKNGRITVVFNPAPERSPLPFEDYYLGDRVPVYASSRFRAPLPDPNVPTSDQQNYQRVYGIPLTIADDATEQVQQMLTALPSA